MRYNGPSDATSIAFTNAGNVAFDPAQPLESKVIEGLNYRLYHVTGDFKASYDFHDYPFDQQQFNIGFQNKHLTSDHLVYAIDAQGLRLNRSNTYDLQSPSGYSAAATPFQSLSTWSYKRTQYASDTFTSRSTLGDPRLFEQRTRTDYSGLQVTMTIQRKSLAYLINHLLPQALLLLLVYASLFLSLKRLGDRLTVTVSALLASAVLLLSINSELPEIGYTVSLDYIYYVFFALCLMCIITVMFMEWLYENGRQRMQRWLNIGLHATYLLVVLATVVYYVVNYGNRFV